MIRNSCAIVLILLFISTGCIKETYDMNRLSEQIHLSPVLAIPVFKGDMTLKDIVRSVDTVIFDENKFGSFILKKDSVIDLELKDFFDFSNMVTFSEIFQIGDLSINAFQVTVNYTLNQIRQRLGSPYSETFGSLDGTTSPFPAFPAVSLGNISFPAITNLERAEFSSGYLVISVKNNLTAPLKSTTYKLTNTADNSVVGNEITLPVIPVGEIRADSIDLADVTVRNMISAEVNLAGSDGNSNPMPISLENNNITIVLTGRNLKVRSGRIIIPQNKLNSSSGTEEINFEAGTGIEIDKLKIINGNFTCSILKPSSLTPSLTLTLPTSLRNGSQASETINLGPGTVYNSNFSFDNTVVDLGTDPDHPYNRLPYTVSISSTGLVDFSSSDEMRLDLRLLNPDIDYIKGYFGQEEETFDPEIIDLELDDILSSMSGSFFVADPRIRINYWNSFAVPVKIDLQATGKSDGDSISLGLDPFTVPFPVTPPGERDIFATKIIDRNNTNLPEIISMPPGQIRFFGSAKMNPEGDPGHLRNNYVFGNSRILGNVEIEVPLEFRVHLQFADTLDNFLAEVFDNNGDFTWDDFKSVRMDFNVLNGFPVGLDLQLNLYDSTRKRIIDSLDGTEILKAATVDTNGKVTGDTQNSVSIELTRDFLSSVDKADNIILNFRINTTGVDPDNIRMYSDYRINFNATVIANSEINLK